MKNEWKKKKKISQMLIGVRNEFLSRLFFYITFTRMIIEPVFDVCEVIYQAAFV